MGGGCSESGNVRRCKPFSLLLSLLPWFCLPPVKTYVFLVRCKEPWLLRLKQLVKLLLRYVVYREVRPEQLQGIVCVTHVECCLSLLSDHFS